MSNPPSNIFEILLLLESNHQKCEAILAVLTCEVQKITDGERLFII